MSDRLKQASKLQLILCGDERDAAVMRAAGHKAVRVVNNVESLYVSGDGPDGFDLDPSLAFFGQFVLAFRPGQEGLRDALAMRLGDLICTYIDWPAETIHPQQVATLLREAKPMWLDEVCTLSGVPEPSPQQAYLSGFPLLDDHGFRIIRGTFWPVIGPYGSGKSVVIRQLACNLWKLYGWRTLITAFEEKIKPRYVRDLRRHIIARAGNLWTEEDIRKADDQIEQAFRFLRRKRGTMLDFERLIDRIEYAVKRYGVDVVIIDPWNEIDHVVPRHFTSKSDYVGHCIMRLKQLADDYNLVMIVCAHPPKDGVEKRSIKGKLLTLNDGADSAHWGNKADIGWAVWRPMLDGPTYLHIDKLKDHEVMGQPTLARLNFDAGMGRFGVTKIGYDIFAELEGA
jgi:twinkle protein